MSRDVIVALATFATGLATGGFAWVYARATRDRIREEARLHAQSIQAAEEARTRDALEDRREAETHAATWSTAFVRLWRYLIDHALDWHSRDEYELPNREDFLPPDPIE